MTMKAKELKEGFFVWPSLDFLCVRLICRDDRPSWPLIEFGRDQKALTTGHVHEPLAKEPRRKEKNGLVLGVESTKVD